jgi:predicted ester cyclase
MITTEKNKDIVRRFNQEVLGRGDRATFDELVSDKLINRTAPPAYADKEGVWTYAVVILRSAFPDMQVEIFDQIAEDNKVMTRKVITGTHLGPLMGIAPTGRKVRIDVFDVVRLEHGQYVEHWGLNTLAVVLGELRNSD